MPIYIIEEVLEFGNWQEGADLHAQVPFLHNLVDLLGTMSWCTRQVFMLIIVSVN